MSDKKGKWKGAQKYPSEMFNKEEDPSLDSGCLTGSVRNVNLSKFVY